MPTFKVSDELDLAVQATAVIHGDDPLVDTLYSLWRAMQAIFVCDKIQMSKQPDPATDFLFKVVAHDGRTWSQVVVPGADRAHMQLSPHAGPDSDRWFLSELDSFRGLRDLFLQLITASGMTSIVIKIP